MSLILSGTDGISDVDGSASTPALRGTDANTGIFFPAADTIAFSEGGVESMRIDSAGNVGIGTASPVEKLTVAGSISTNIDLVLKQGTTDRGYIFGTSSGLFYRATSGLPHVFQNVGTELMRIDSSGNVGIGTSSPSSYYATQLVVNGGADGGITVVNTTTGDARLMFADGTAGDARYAGQIVYNHGNNYMMFGTNGGNERMRITSGGSLLFGTTDSIANITSSSGTGLALYNSSGNTQFLASNANDNVIQANRQGTDGAIIALRKAGTVAGTIDVTATGVTYTGTNGITFTATQTASAGANTLDDYEEGTWTPSVGGNATYTARTANYTKVGNLVYIQCSMTINAIGTGSTAVISGLPFTSKNIGTVQAIYACYYVSIANSVTWLSGYIENNNTTIQFTGNSTAATTIQNNGFVIFGNSTNIQFSACYITS